MWDACVGNAMTDASNTLGTARPDKAARQIDTPAKRIRLSRRKNPYWQGVSGGRGGVSLGYRRGHGVGTWVVKVVIDGARTEERLGVADDDGAGNEALSFPAAVSAALQWGEQQFAIIEVSRETAREATVPTVWSAVATYAAKRKKLAGHEGSEVNLLRHVPKDSSFAKLRLAKLTAKAMEDWVAQLERLPRTKKKRKSGDPAPTLPPLEPGTRNRLLGDLRAALNDAAFRHRRILPGHILAEIKAGSTNEPIDEEARKQLLSDSQVLAIIESAFEIDVDFAYLVLIAAMTGARYSQIARLKVSDTQIANCRIMMPSSRKGRNRKSRAPAAIAVHPEVMDRLNPLVARRASTEVLLWRWVHKRVGKPPRWIRDKRRTWGDASEVKKLWAKTVKLSGVPDDTIMYALRHSSIVRGLMENMPVRVVAALHDTSVRMIELHYSAFILDMADELARKHAMPLSGKKKRVLQAAE
jgi:integrase